MLARLKRSRRSGSVLAGAVAVFACVELDSFVIAEALEVRSKHLRVTRRRVVDMAAKILWTMAEQPGLALSNGWLECFLSRQKLVLRKRINKPKLSAQVIATRGANFILHLRKLVREYKTMPQNVINLDDTAVLADHEKETTLADRGATDAPVRSLGFEKIRLDAVLAVRSDGIKLNPCVLDKGKESRISTEQGIPVITNAKSWMDSDSFIRYVDFMFPFPEPTKNLLVFDSSPSYMSKKVKTHLQARKILYAVIPGWLTSFVQLCDYGVFNSLKERLTDLIDNYKKHGPHSYTAGGNVHPPSLSTVVGWIKAAWSEIARHQFAAASVAAFSEKTPIYRFGVTKSTDSISSDLCSGATSPTLSHLLLLDDNSSSDMDMDIDDDEYELDFSNAPDLICDSIGAHT